MLSLVFPRVSRSHFIRTIATSLLQIPRVYQLTGSSKNQISTYNTVASLPMSNTAEQMEYNGSVEKEKILNLANGAQWKGVTLEELPKSHIYTTRLPHDELFPNPEASDAASRDALKPRAVKGACFTWVRPSINEPHPELLAVSTKAMETLGLKMEEACTDDFKNLVAGKKIYKEHYPWAQAYGGWQFGQWAGQLGDGRAISLFESTNPFTGEKNELQLKGAGQTPYSRFADGKAVLRSSIREFIVSEALHALRIPTTRALSLTLLPNTRAVRQEGIEKCAIVCRFAKSWIRIGNFDLFRWRGERKVLKTLADYVIDELYEGVDNLALPIKGLSNPKDPKDMNRYERLYREVVRRNAKTVAHWQCYGFMNGVLNTDNTSILGLSLDFGPFGFMNNFDPNYTPNHDDYTLRYSYKSQVSAVWWNLIKLGEDLAELLAVGDLLDQTYFINKNASEEEELERLGGVAEKIIIEAGEEYKSVFMDTYLDLMCKKLGILKPRKDDIENFISPTFQLLEDLNLDLTHFFRRLSSIPVLELKTREEWYEAAKGFAQTEHSYNGKGYEKAMEMITNWIAVVYRPRVLVDVNDAEPETRTDKIREKEMKEVNPKFIPRTWVLQEVIDSVEKDSKDLNLLHGILRMATDPFAEHWNWNQELEERYCGDPPRVDRQMQCSCSS